VFPKVPDQHKTGKPLVSNGLGVLYVLFTTIYLFLVYFSGFVKPLTSSGGTTLTNEVSVPLTLAVCVLFGGFMGLLDDWMDLKWRYKAFMPLIAALPLVYLASQLSLRTSVTLPFLGVIQLSHAYYYLVIPLIVMVVTNTVNMLGGLNGLETICPGIVVFGLIVSSYLTLGKLDYVLLMLGPLLFWLVLAVFNAQGKIFVGNSGSFAIGMTIASFSVISDLKSNLAISLLPYVFNSVLVLLTFFFVRKKAQVAFDGQKLVSDHRRSLITLITYRRPLTERQVVAIISLIVAIFTAVPVMLQLL
jgi:UDP-N-acetylglucosamine--dolichyl-phosphate N-acetylglucosaminephosphotransferase